MMLVALSFGCGLALIDVSCLDCGLFLVPMFVAIHGLGSWLVYVDW